MVKLSCFKIQELRESANISVDFAAKYLGISNRTYKKYEYGVAVPSVEKLEKLATLFGVSISAFFDNDISTDKSQTELKTSKNEISDIIKKVSFDKVAIHNLKVKKSFFNKYKKIDFKKVGETFKKIRMDNKTSLISLSNKVKINRKRLSNIEKGDIEPTISEFFTLCAYCKITAHEALNIEDDYSKQIYVDSDISDEIAEILINTIN